MIMNYELILYDLGTWVWIVLLTAMTGREEMAIGTYKFEVYIGEGPK